MITCQKRQRVVTKGKKERRCIHKESDVCGQIVDVETCEACPLNKPKIDFNIWDVECGVCPRREPIDNMTATCITIKKIVTRRECKICLLEQKKYNLDAEKILAKANEEKQFPPITTQVNSYRLAIKRWIKAGRPVRSEEETKKIFETHCVKCDWFDGRRCKGCGCRVVPKGLAIFNKLKMATEHCPKRLF